MDQTTQRKNDLNRIGLFSEMPYMLDDKYEKPEKLNTIRDMKKPQMYPSAVKTKSGVLDNYFDKQFKSLYENEKWQSPSKGVYLSPRGGNNNKTENKPIFSPWPSAKCQSTPGDYYGTFGPKLPAMSNEVKPKPKKKVELPNIKTKPTNTRGPGYVDIGLSKFPSYMTDPYEYVPKKPKKKKEEIPFKPSSVTQAYFQNNPYFTNDFGPTYIKNSVRKFEGIPFKPPNKQSNVGNGFDKWPVHTVEPYIDPNKIENSNIKNTKSQLHANPFYPLGETKSFYTMSTINRKLRSAMNNNNWHTYKTVTTWGSNPKSSCNL